MLNQKEKMIFFELWIHKTGLVLCDQQGIGGPSVLYGSDSSDLLKNVRWELTKLGEGVVVKSNRGLVTASPSKMKNCTSNSWPTHHIKMANTVFDDRHHFILNKLLFCWKGFSLKTWWTSSLLVLPLSADFKKLRQLLENTTWPSKAGPIRSLCFWRHEQDKRHFIMDYFFSGQFMKNIHQYVRHDVPQVAHQLWRTDHGHPGWIRKQGLKLSDFVISKSGGPYCPRHQRLESGFRFLPSNWTQSAMKGNVGGQNILHRIRLVTDWFSP